MLYQLPNNRDHTVQPVSKSAPGQHGDSTCLEWLFTPRSPWNLSLQWQLGLAGLGSPVWTSQARWMCQEDITPSRTFSSLPLIQTDATKSRLELRACGSLTNIPNLVWKEGFSIPSSTWHPGQLISTSRLNQASLHCSPIKPHPVLYGELMEW